MNKLGSEKIPFLFMLDFELEKCKVFRLDDIDAEKLLYDIQGQSNKAHHGPLPEKPTLEKFPIPFESYLHKFESVMHRINRGDSFLTNLTCSTPININCTLKELFYHSEAKYKLWLKDELVCFSPEIFVRIKDGKIHSYPMKGTIDAGLPGAENAILSNKKEQAEHFTIVDLIRNDLSRVSTNVRVERFRYIDELKTNNKNLLQVSSEITGDLDEHYQNHIGDILLNMLPAGSVSGAPKDKTAEIIREAENEPRGYYTGVFGIFDGRNLDSSVMIRFIENTPDGLKYRSGGGITSFSKAELEYQEMIDKIYVPIT